MLIRLPLPQCFWPRGRKLRPWSGKNSGPKPRPPQTLYLPGKGETQTMVWVSGEGKLRPWSEFGVFFGVGVDEGALKSFVKICQDRKISPEIKVFGRMFLGTPGARASGYPWPQHWDVPEKALCKAPFSVVLNRMAGTSCDSGRDVPGSKKVKLYARELRADLSHPTLRPQRFLCTRKSLANGDIFLRWKLAN